MKSYPLNKKLEKKPNVLGLSINIGYTYLGFTAVMVFSFLMFFTFRGFIVMVCLDIALYAGLVFIDSQGVKKIQKKIWTPHVKAIKNSSIAPFKYDCIDE